MSIYSRAYWGVPSKLDPEKLLLPKSIYHIRHNNIRSLEFFLRKARRDLKSQPGRYFETEVSWCEHNLWKANQECEA